MAGVYFRIAVLKMLGSVLSVTSNFFLTEIPELFNWLQLATDFISSTNSTECMSSHVAPSLGTIHWVEFGFNSLISWSTPLYSLAIIMAKYKLYKLLYKIKLNISFIV